MKKGLVVGLVVLVIIIVIFVLMIFSPGKPSDENAQQSQEPTCNQDAVGAWWLVGNQVYFIVESDCSISKFCDLTEIDIHTTGSISGNNIIIDGITTKEFIMNGSNTFIMLGGADGIDLPFTRIYREYGIDPIPEDC
jgi:hypothetical protein